MRTHRTRPAMDGPRSAAGVWLPEPRTRARRSWRSGDRGAVAPEAWSRLLGAALVYRATLSEAGTARTEFYRATGIRPPSLAPSWWLRSEPDRESGPRNLPDRREATERWRRANRAVHRAGNELDAALGAVSGDTLTTEMVTIWARIAEDRCYYDLHTDQRLATLEDRARELLVALADGRCPRGAAAALRRCHDATNRW